MDSGACRSSWGGNTIEDDWTDWVSFFREGILQKGGLAENFVGIGVFCGKIILGREGVDLGELVNIGFWMFCCYFVTHFRGFRS